MSEKRCEECNGTGIYTPDEDEWSSTNEKAKGAPCPACNGTGKEED